MTHYGHGCAIHGRFPRRLAVHAFGDVPPVQLLHAGIVDSWAWESLTPFSLAVGCRVVAFDRSSTSGSTTGDEETRHEWRVTSGHRRSHTIAQ